MTCCDARSMNRKAAIKLGKGGFRERLNALGNKAYRAPAANSVGQMRSLSWEKKETRVNLIFNTKVTVIFRNFN